MGLLIQNETKDRSKTMTDNNLDALLRAVHDRDLRQAPARHPQMTDACPSLPDLAAALREGRVLSSHVQTCPHCRKMVEMYNDDVAVPALLAVALALVAQQKVRRQRAAGHCATDADAPSPRQVFTFPDDPGLSAVIRQAPDAMHWLHLEHTDLPAGTLLLIQFEGAGAGWARFVVLRQGLEHAVARLRVEEALPPVEQEGGLSVSEVPSATDLGPNATGVLAESFAAVREQDPAAVAAWREWARQALAEEDLAADLRAALESITQACELPGTGGIARTADEPAKALFVPRWAASDSRVA
jgi:hypothetical protein